MGSEGMNIFIKRMLNNDFGKYQYSNNTTKQL